MPSPRAQFRPGRSERPNTVLILSSKILKLELGSKMAFFSLLGLPLRETMAKIPKPQCRQLSDTQVNAEKSPKTVTVRL